MRRFLVSLALAAIFIPASAYATDWFEAQVSFFETIDGKFAPSMTIQAVNYIDNKGVGLFLGKDESFGPAISWRVFEKWWSPAWGTAVHLSANTDLWQGQDSLRRENATYLMDFRWFWSALDGKFELSTPVQATFINGEKYEWTFGLQLVFTPGRTLNNLAEKR